MADRIQKNEDEKVTNSDVNSQDMITSQNNNMTNPTPGGAEPNVERANNAGIGPMGQNDEKLTSYKSNSSADAG